MASEQGVSVDSRQALREARAATPLNFKHDANLPITARREEICEALRLHQVLIVAGDTGSGKSTQLPQYCLEIGRGIEGLIAHTQPRRLAARALAARIADELSQPVGGTAGFRVRFADQVSAVSRVVLMTDGLLLAELSSDPYLRRYDTVIVDEAHERSLNVDLLLGVLKRLLPRRPDLKLIVTSATLDVERVAHFFDGAPIIAVSGRNYPIEVRYAPAPDDAEDPDLPAAVLAAYREIAAEPGAIAQGDVLVFLPGEREIRDVAEVLERELQAEADVLQLFSRLPWDRQSAIFQRGARRRIVLATNVAETSITVPGIRSVIDSGLVRISRYSPRNRLQRLPIEPVSRAGAEQRKGRCGRLGSGLCLRLYTEADFAQRPAFTEPEVLRTNLAALLLRLAADGLGEAESFPFIDAPDARSLSDGYRLLQELQALDEERRITRTGRAMARLPLDPRLARALLESQRFRAEAELLAIVAGLSVPDARITIPGSPEDPAATLPFEDAKSEFSVLVKLWRAYRKARERPRRELRRWCKEHRLSLLRLSEWDDVYAQVCERAADIGIAARREPASYTAVHRALLAGFCSMVGTRGEDGAYLGTRGVHFFIFPGSPLKRRRPRWVLAANIVETSRVFARCVADIEPTWIEAAARHLLKREFLEPDWDEAREEVVARERISLLGLILSANRIVNYGPIAPEESRLIFAREALVYQRLQRRPEWLAANDAAIRDARRLEERLRTRDLLQGPEALVEFYDRALPRQVSSGATLEHFTRRMSEAQRRALTLSAEHLFLRQPDPDALAQYPETLRVAAITLPVEYRFAPGEADDGATLRIPLLALPLTPRAAVDAAIPGYAVPRVEALLRSLPKDARRSLIPIAETAAQFVAAAPQTVADLHALTAWLSQSRGIPVPLLRFDLAAVPQHLTPQFAVIDGGREIARGADLASLRRRCATRARAELARHARRIFPAPWQRFEADTLENPISIDVAEGSVQVFPTLGLARESLGVARESPDPAAGGAPAGTPAGALEVQFEWSEAEALHRWRQGAVRLARVMLAAQARDLSKEIARDSPLVLAAGPYVSGAALIDLMLQLTFRRACFGDQDPPRTRPAFEAAIVRARERLHPCLLEVAAGAQGWFSQARAIRGVWDDPRLGSRAQAPASASASALAQSLREARAHVLALLQADALAACSNDALRQLPRYLKAEERRWQRALARGGEPPQVAREIETWSARVNALSARLHAEHRWQPALDELRLWVEEYRVSLYAQELKTLGPVSAARLEQRAAELEAWLAR